MSSNGPGTDPSIWEQRYVDGDVPWDAGEPDVHLRRFLESYEVSPGATLDVGCGTGTDAIWLQSLGFDVLGVDLSPTAIEHARAKAAEADSACRFRVADIRSDAIAEAPFSLVYDRGCFHIFDQPEERALFARRIAELLEPEGLWRSLIGSKDGPQRDSGPPRRSVAEVVAAVEPHFEILGLQATSFDEQRHAHARAWVLVSRRRTQ